MFVQRREDGVGVGVQVSGVAEQAVGVRLVVAGLKAGEHAGRYLVCGCGHAQLQPSVDVVEVRRQRLPDDFTGVALVGVAAGGVVGGVVVKRLQWQR